MLRSLLKTPVPRKRLLGPRQVERLEGRCLLAMTPQVILDLANDTGKSADDNVSSQVAIVGQLVDDGFITALSASFTGAPPGSFPVDIGLLLQSDGSFLISEQTLLSIRLEQFGTTFIPDGAYGLTVYARDNENRVGNSTLFFTLDTTPPLAPTVTLPTTYDPDQDGVTTASQVALVASTNVNIDVQLDRTGETGLTNNFGKYQFTAVPLFVGTNNLTVTAYDLAGNSSTGGISIIRQSDSATPNQAPSFTKGADITVTVNAGARTYPNWATNISPGPNESGQTVNFLVTNDNGGLFSVAPQISSTGTLTFTAATGQVGSALVTVRLHDNGGIDNGGVDTSDAQTFRIAVVTSPAAETIGFYNPAQSTFFLKNANSQGLSDVVFPFGPNNSGWKALVGDWNGDGVDTVGFYHPATSTFFLKNANSQGLSDLVFSYGPPNSGWTPLVGDWNGDGSDTVGFYDPATSTFFLKNANSPGLSNVTFSFGPSNSGWIPLTGDWNGDSFDTIGFYNPQTSTFFLKNTNSQGLSNLVFSYGPANSGWKPLVGDWNGDGFDSVGFYAPATSTFFLKNTNGQGLSDVTFNFGPSNTNWTPLVGDWNGPSAGPSGLVAAPAAATAAVVDPDLVAAVAEREALLAQLVLWGRSSSSATEAAESTPSSAGQLKWNLSADEWFRQLGAPG